MKTFRTFLLFLFCFVHGPGGVFAQAEGNATRVLSGDEAILLAYRNNPELRLAELELRRAETRLRWAGRLPNPKLELSAGDDSLGLDENEQNLGLGFSQSFPVTSRLRDEKLLRRAQIVLARAEVAERRRALAAEVDVAALKLAVERRQIEQSRELAVVNEEVAEYLRRQAERGEASPLDVTQADLTGQTLAHQVEHAEAKERALALNLNRLLGLEPDESIEIRRPLDLPVARPNLRDSMDEVRRRRPDHLLALAEIDEALASLQLERARRWEDVTARLFVDWERETDAPGGPERNTVVGLGVSFPLPLRDRNQEGIALAKLKRARAEQAAAALRFRIRSEYEQAFRQRLATWEFSSHAAGEILRLAEKNLADSQSAHRRGQTGYLQVHRAQEQLLESKSAALEALADYHFAAARLREVSGHYPTGEGEEMGRQGNGETEPSRP